MVRLKKYKLTLLSLFAVLILCIGAFFARGVLFAKATGTMTVSGTSVFTSSGDAKVIAHKEADTEFYTMFTFAKDGDIMSYRKNLAYTWQEAELDADKKIVGHKQGYFSTEIGFEVKKSFDFEMFKITFESMNYNSGKEDKSKNFVIFTPVKGNRTKLNVYITDDEKATSESLAEEFPTPTALDASRIKIEFVSRTSDKYSVKISNPNGEEGAPVLEGEFKNVRGTYAKASTSSSSPLYPLIYEASFPEAKEGVEYENAKLVLYSLNGQSFKLTDVKQDSGIESSYYGGVVTDNMPPVLCLENDVAFFKIGSEVEASYVTIDVLRSSPTSSMYFYVLTYEQYLQGQDTATSKIDYENKDLFTEKTSSKKLLLETDEKYYLPQDADISDGNPLKDGFDAELAVKVYLKLTDSSSSNETSTVYLDWYIKDELLLNINETPFIAVGKESKGVTYAYDGVNGKSWNDITEEYAEKVKKAAKDLSAGSSSNIYLPSAEELFVSKVNSYENLTFSIYYYHNSKEQKTNLKSNGLSINVTTQGSYTFMIYATDSEGNKMYGRDGEEFGTDDIWDIYDDDEAQDIPWFTFDVGYSGVKFDKTPGAQSTAYVGKNYTAASFDINGISDSYDTVYRLFLFDRAKYFEDTQETLTYAQFIDKMGELFDGAETRAYFSEIFDVSSLPEDDEKYQKYKDYGWKKSSTSFTPCDANAFYMIRAEVSDKEYTTDPVVCQLGVVASAKTKTLKGESDWIKNNIESVILLGVAFLALVGIVLLLVIKPKNKNDIDQTYEEVKNAKAKKGSKTGGKKTNKK